MSNRDMKTNTELEQKSLLHAAGTMLGAAVLRADYQATPLQGGTLGDVRLVTGTAETRDGRTLDFRMVLKTQKRWDRPGDPASWRREYDLYQSGFGDIFTPAFRQPHCYHAQIDANENRIWMEYADGVSGKALALEYLEHAALELGRFQGRCARQAEALRRIACLGDTGYMERDFGQWTPDTVEYRWLRSDACTLPEHLQQLLIDTQAEARAVFQTLRRLPQVLCHRDFWTENIIVSNGTIVLIDWDCAGWGYIGEDVASLIADETDPLRIGEYYQTLLPAYVSGLSETMAIPQAGSIPVREMILIKFGYRLLQQVMFDSSPAHKQEAILALEQIAALPRAD